MAHKRTTIYSDSAFNPLTARILASRQMAGCDTPRRWMMYAKRGMRLKASRQLVGKSLRIIRRLEACIFLNRRALLCLGSEVRRFSKNEAIGTTEAFS